MYDRLPKVRAKRDAKRGEVLAALGLDPSLHKAGPFFAAFNSLAEEEAFMGRLHSNTAHWLLTRVKRARATVIAEAKRAAEQNESHLFTLAAITATKGTNMSTKGLSWKARALAKNLKQS